MPKGIKGFQKGHLTSYKTRKKISIAKKGTIFTEEHRKKLSEKNKGRNVSEITRKKISNAVTGKFNGNWKGGTSSLPYTVDWTKSLRISIRERDKYICVICKEKQNDYAFDIHHIDYNKKHCNPNNLVTLCRSCHIRTNTNRNYWKKVLTI